MTDISIEYSKNKLQLLDLFDGKISFEELNDMDVPQLTSLVEAKLQYIAEREELYKRQKRQ